MNPDDPEPIEYVCTRTDYSIKLYIGNDISRCRAILFTNLNFKEAEELYYRINESFGHQRGEDGELIVLGDKLPYVLIDW